jgi:hypothetical protein
MNITESDGVPISPRREIGISGGAFGCDPGDQHGLLPGRTY